MQIKNEIGIIKNFHINEFNNTICLILETKKYSKDSRKHYCKIFVENGILYMPKKNIKILN